MGLETGTGIGDLVPANPLSTDAVSSGDDHIRLIKTVMQSITFLKNVVTFTASGTWTRPANVRRILIYCLGGGGGGGGGAVNAHSAGGGSSGAIAVKWLDVTAIASATVTVGAGGAGGASGTAGSLGSNGSVTSFVSAGPVTHCQAREGLGGEAFYLGGPSHAASLSTGDITFAGNPGTTGNLPNATGAYGGQGGGAGGRSNASAPANSGGGGGGGQSGPASGDAGGTGGSGYCFVLEFGW